MDERKAAANSAQAQPEKGMRLCAARYKSPCLSQWFGIIFGRKRTNKKGAYQPISASEIFLV